MQTTNSKRPNKTKSPVLSGKHYSQKGAEQVMSKRNLNKTTPVVSGKHYSHKGSIQSMSKLPGGPKQSEFKNPDGTPNRQAYLDAYYAWKAEQGLGTAPKPKSTEAVEDGRTRVRNIDPNRDHVHQILKEVPILLKVPASYRDITKEVFEPTHHCFLYTEKLSNGKSYTVEFHVDPSEEPVICEIYVIDAETNQTLQNKPIYIGDLDEVDTFGLEAAAEIDALLQKAVDSTPNTAE